MKQIISTVVILFSLFASNVSASYVYQVANSELLKGILLGAILASQQNNNRFGQMPYPLLNLLQKTLQSNRQSEEEQQMDSSVERSITDYFKSLNDTTTSTPELSTTETTTTTDNTRPPSAASMLSLNPYNNFDIAKHNMHNMVLMMMPSYQNYNHEPLMETFNNKDGVTHHLKRNDLPIISGLVFDPNIQTNAVSVGSQTIHQNGWIPVSKTINGKNEQNNYNKRLNRSRPYIENSAGYMNKFGKLKK